MNHARFSPDGMFLATGKKVWDVEQATLVTSMTGQGSVIRSVAFSPDGRMLATGGENMTIIYWNTATWTRRLVLPVQARPVRSIAFSPDGKILAAMTVAPKGQRGGEITLWEAESPRVVGVLTANPGVNWTLAFSPDGETLASTCAPGFVRLPDVYTSQEQRLF